MKLTGLITIEKIREAINSLYDNLPSIATQAEAEAGTDNTKMMTPLRTEQAIESKVGNDANKIPRYNADGHLVLPDGSEFWIG